MSSVQAQSLQWSPAQTIPGFDSEAWPPILVSDHNGNVHAFSSQWIISDNGASNKAIVYNQWNPDRGWSTPNDILLSPQKEARITDVFIDEEGMFHLLFFGGDGDSANIYYAQAHVNVAENARAWSYPVIVGENAADPENAVFAIDDQGNFNVIYFGEQDGNGLYVVNSDSNFSEWSEPKAFFFPPDFTTPNIYYLRIIKSETGWLHAIWGVYNIGGQGRGIYYMRSRDAKNWSEPIILANAEESYGTQTPTIIEYQGTIFAIFNDGGFKMRRSTDNGQFWDIPETMFRRHVGVNGAASLVIDSNEDMHIFFGQRIPGSPSIHGIWHSSWVENHWSEPEGVIKGPANQDLVGDKSFDPFEARAAVSQGNDILVTWRTDPGLKGNGVWYSHKELDAPKLPAIPYKPTLSENILVPTRTSTDNIVQNNTANSSIELPGQITPFSKDNPNTAIAIGIFPVVTLILTIILWKIVKYKFS